MTYPYANTVPGLVAAIRQLRSQFPAVITADSFKKWAIAPNNETYILSVLRFLGIIDAEGKKVAEAGKILLKGDAEFAEGFSELVAKAYAGLFEHFGQEAWNLPRQRLLSYFRGEDDTSEVVGNKQAGTFEGLAELSGKRITEDQPKRSSPGQARSRVAKKSASARRTSGAAETAKQVAPGSAANGGVSPGGLGAGKGTAQHNDDGLNVTVRIEINLPVADDQEVYDRIFKSMRANLLQRTPE